MKLKTLKKVFIHYVLNNPRDFNEGDVDLLLHSLRGREKVNLFQALEACEGLKRNPKRDQFNFSMKQLIEIRRLYNLYSSGKREDRKAI